MAEQRQIQKKFFPFCLRKSKRIIYPLLFCLYAYVASENQALRIISGCRCKTLNLSIILCVHCVAVRFRS